MEVWGLVRDLHKIKKSRASNNLRNLSTDTVTVTVDAASVSAVDLAPESIDPSDSEDPDFLKVGLFLCNQIADLHERARKYASLHFLSRLC